MNAVNASGALNPRQHKCLYLKIREMKIWKKLTCGTTCQNENVLEMIYVPDIEMGPKAVINS